MKRNACGVLIKCTSTNKVLLVLRSRIVTKSLKWSLISGGMDDGENPDECVKREVEEELSIDSSVINFKFKRVEEDDPDFTFHYYEGFTDSEFIPTLCSENLAWGWFDPNNLPEPLYPNIELKIKAI